MLGALEDKATLTSPSAFPTIVPRSTLAMESCSIVKLTTSLSGLEMDKPEAKENFDSFLSKKAKVEEISNGDLSDLDQWGPQNRGPVLASLHVSSGFVVARKIIPLDQLPQTPKRVLEDLQILHSCQSDFIVGFYDAFYYGMKISLCMEYMDEGSLETLLSRIGPFPEKALAKITVGVVKGLSYLNDEHGMIHGNLKPSNILVNSKGHVKLSDFQAAKMFTYAKKKVQAETYMSPEGVQGEQYSAATDIWTLGVCLIELATGEFPIPLYFVATSLGSTKMCKVIEYVINGASPRLPAGQYTKDFEHVVNRCLHKVPSRRLDLSALMNHVWIERWERGKFDLAEWIHARKEKVDET